MSCCFDQCTSVTLSKQKCTFLSYMKLLHVNNWHICKTINIIILVGLCNLFMNLYLKFVLNNIYSHKKYIFTNFIISFLFSSLSYFAVVKTLASILKILPYNLSSSHSANTHCVNDNAMCWNNIMLAFFITLCVLRKIWVTIPIYTTGSYLFFNVHYTSQMKTVWPNSFR